MCTVMENPYNQVPYPGGPFPQAHVMRLATKAVLHGLEPPDVAGCRVLELGCGDGSHLIPMAIEFPDSQFVGVDMAEVPIVRATALSEELGLENVTFRTADVSMLSGQPGECDYLIAHGLFSWVDRSVQDKVFELAGRVLARSGIAYISYNAYPGWHVREMTRNVVRIHTANVMDPVEIRNRAISLLASMYRARPETDVTREIIRAEMERIVAKDPVLLYHDDFGEENHPQYFTEFIKRATPYELQYLAEADLLDMNNSDFPPEAVESLNQIADVIEREQYYDFLTMRMFRRTLLCRNELVVDRELPMERLRKLYYAAMLRPTPQDPEVTTFAPAQFGTQSGASITVNQPFVKAVLMALTRAWPATLTFDELLDDARRVAPLLSRAEAEDMLREVIMRMQVPGILEISTLPYRYATSVSEKPSVSRLALAQARHSERVTSLRHRPVDLDDEKVRNVLPLVDGTRTKAELAVTLGDDVSAKAADIALNRLLELCLLES